VLAFLNLWEQQQTQTHHLIRRVRGCSACLWAYTILGLSMGTSLESFNPGSFQVPLVVACLVTTT